MSAHDVKLFGDQIAASRLETRFAQLKASSLLRLAIEDLYPGRIALVSSFGADAAALLHMVAQIDTATPVIFVDTGQHFPETLAYRDDLCHALEAHQRHRRRAERRDPRAGRPGEIPVRQRSGPLLRDPQGPARSLRRWKASTPGSPAARAFQSTTRATLPLFEAEGERIKINPLVGWSASDVLEIYRRRRLAPASSGRQGLSVDRLPALHEPGQARRGRARRPLARARQGRVRHPCRPARRWIGHLMPLWRREGFVEDAWAFLGDEAPVPEEGAIVVSLKRWLSEREALSARTAPVGVAVEAGADAQAHLADLAEPAAGRARLRQVRRRPVVLLRPALARPAPVSRRIARDRRRADRRNPAHAALRL